MLAIGMSSKENNVFITVVVYKTSFKLNIDLYSGPFEIDISVFNNEFIIILAKTQS